MDGDSKEQEGRPGVRPICVFIADDMNAMRKVMAQMIDREKDMLLVEASPRLDSAVEMLKTLDCDVIVMDDYIPPLRSEQAVALMRVAGVTAPILVVSMHEDLKLAAAALTGGANGFLLKTDFFDHFVPAIRALHGGDSYFSPALSEGIEAWIEASELGKKS